jgi:hypothetical protein
VVTIWIVAYSGTTYNHRLFEEPSRILWHGLAIATPNRRNVMMWDWLWANARYSLDDLAERSSLTAPLVERKPKPLIGNRVLYPDGTVNSFVQRYLRERVLGLFDAKPREAAKGTWRPFKSRMGVAQLPTERGQDLPPESRPRPPIWKRWVSVYAHV